MRQFLGTREAYRKLGFSADDIFCEVARSMLRGGVLSGFATLKTQGKSFSCELGDVVSEDAFSEEYKRVCEAVNTHAVSENDLDRIWQESMAFNMPGSFITTLINRGFAIPIMQESLDHTVQKFLS
jgi:hypothetical protein